MMDAPEGVDDAPLCRYRSSYGISGTSGRYVVVPVQKALSPLVDVTRAHL
jgi:hypothetical protein